MPTTDVPTVHAVTDDAILAREGFVEAATAVLDAVGPRGAVHLRGSRTPGQRLFALTCTLVPVAAASGGWVVVNDRVDVAAAAGAHGVQLTSHSLSPRDARAVGPLRIGASVHARDEAMAAVADGADWVVVGHLFATPSHPGVPGGGIALLRAIAEVAPRVIAIGGITPARAAEVAAAGGTGIAAIRGIWDAPDPGGAAADYLSTYDAGAGGQ